MKAAKNFYFVLLSSFDEMNPSSRRCPRCEHVIEVRNTPFVVYSKPSNHRRHVSRWLINDAEAGDYQHCLLLLEHCRQHQCDAERELRSSLFRRLSFETQLFVHIRQWTKWNQSGRIVISWETLPWCLGIDTFVSELRRFVFSLGQHYVALSDVRHPSKPIVLLGQLKIHTTLKT